MGGGRGGGGLLSCSVFNLLSLFMLPDSQISLFYSFIFVFFVSMLFQSKDGGVEKVSSHKINLDDKSEKIRA